MSDGVVIWCYQLAFVLLKMMIPAMMLSSGNAIPMVGFGTYRVGVTPKSVFEVVSTGRDGKAVIKNAIEAGYR